MAITVKPNINTKLAPSSLVIEKDSNNSITSVKLKIDKPNNQNDYILKVIVKYGFGEIITSTPVAGSSIENNEKIEFVLSDYKAHFKDNCGYQFYFFYSSGSTTGPYTISNLYLIPSNNESATITAEGQRVYFNYSNTVDPVTSVTFKHYPDKDNTGVSKDYSPININYDEQLDPSNV